MVTKNEVLELIIKAGFSAYENTNKPENEKEILTYFDNQNITDRIFVEGIVNDFVMVF